MSELTRRGFLGGLGLGLATLYAKGGVRAFAAPAGARGVTPTAHQTLVVVMQRGACDGLAIAPPHGDPEYTTARPTIGAGLAAGALDLDGYFSLHAKLGALLPHFAAKRLAVVPAVGLHGASRSHFEAQDLLEQGGALAPTGWANRFLSSPAVGPGVGSVGPAMAVGTTLPRALAGPAAALAIQTSGDVGIARRMNPRRRALVLDAFTDLYAQGSDPFAETARRALASAAQIEAALAALPTPAVTIGAGAVGATTPTPTAKGPIGQALRTAARLIRANLGTQLVIVDTTGWDTHTGEVGRLERQFTQLGDGIAAFAAELGDRLNLVTLVTISEFGRTVHENGTGGTDHGTATTALVLGGTIAGGRVVGTFPGLRADQRFEGRDLAIATDTRDLLGELLGEVLGVTRESLRTLFPDHEPARVALYG